MQLCKQKPPTKRTVLLSTVNRQLSTSLDFSHLYPDCFLKQIQKQMTETFGYIAALLIGLSLGLVGGGGSILTVPVLVYLFAINPLAATSYSLFIVGTTSLVGSLNSLRHGWVDLRTVFYFGISSILTVFLTRKWIIPAIPLDIPVAGTYISFPATTMVLFALLMLLASWSMIRAGRKVETVIRRKRRSSTIFLYGIGIGLVTGFLGAGGGFLLVPALVLILKLPMKTAIGSSLLIIALNSLTGFLADIGQYKTDWSFLGIFTAIAIGGILLGGLLGKRIEGRKLKTGFGWFVMGMGLFVLAMELMSANY
jgi:uncharacterized membrane protein YfcA